jgi:4-amino-4-deoxy-L-arabinose transferase-like glycosyltransferase
MKRIKDNRINGIFYSLLLIILLSAVCIRYQGIKFGLPLAPHPDELLIINKASAIVKNADCNPHFFNYPSLYIYMQSALIKAHYEIGKITGKAYSFTAIDRSTTFVIGRLLTLLLSLGTIGTVYVIGTVLFDRTTGLLSTLFIVFSFLHITHSYVATVDSPMVFWAMLSFLMSAVIFLNGPKLRYYILNGIFIGLAIGTKYTAFIAVVPLLYSHLYRHSFSIKKIFDRKLILAFLVLPLAFIISTPYAILDFQKFYTDILWEAKHYSETGHPGYEAESTSYRAYSSCLLNGFGLIPIIISFLGIVRLLWNKKSTAFLLLLFPSSFFIFVGSYKVCFERNILIAIPFLSIFAGYYMAATLQSFFEHAKHCVIQIREKQIIAMVGEKNFYLSLILVTFGLAAAYGVYGQGFKSYEYMKKISLPNTIWISTKWIENNIPPGSKIALDYYTPRPDKTLFKLDYAGLCGLAKKSNLQMYDYLVASSGDYGRFFMKKEEKYEKVIKNYENIFTRYTLIKEFTANNIDMTGPTIKIFKVN